MPRVLVTPAVLREQAGPYRETLDAAGFEVVYPPEGLALSDPTTLIGQLQGIDAVLASTEPYNREVLSAAKLRVISRNGIGYDSIDVLAATELRIPVAITPGVNMPSVAEHTIAMMLAVAHGFPARDKLARRGSWAVRPILPRLAGRTLGIVGIGAIGKAVVPLAIGLGLEVIAHDPAPDCDFATRLGVRLCSMDELLARADVVSLHLPCTPETTDTVNADMLAKMKPGAILVNTSRGGLVDEDALVEVLRSGHLAAAALDVFKAEPLPADSPLAQLENVLLSPHMAGADRESLTGMSIMAAQSIVELHAGGWPEGRIVNPSIRDGWKW